MTDSEKTYRAYGRPCSRYFYRVAVAEAGTRAAFWGCVAAVVLTLGSTAIWIAIGTLLVFAAQLTVSLIDVHGDLPRGCRARAAARARAKRLKLDQQEEQK